MADPTYVLLDQSLLDAILLINTTLTTSNTHRVTALEKMDDVIGKLDNIVTKLDTVSKTLDDALLEIKDNNTNVLGQMGDSMIAAQVSSDNTLIKLDGIITQMTDTLTEIKTNNILVDGKTDDIITQMTDTLTEIKAQDIKVISELDKIVENIGNTADNIVDTTTALNTHNATTASVLGGLLLAVEEMNGKSDGVFEAAVLVELIKHNKTLLDFWGLGSDHDHGIVIRETDKPFVDAAKVAFNKELVTNA